MAVEYSSASMLYCQVQIDGQWYGWRKPITLGVLAGMLAPGKEYTLKIQLTDSWAALPLAAPGATKKPKWLALASGGHLVRVSFAGYPKLGKREGGIRCVSNPVYVEIEKQPASRL